MNNSIWLIFSNPVFIISMLSWSIAQLIKVPIEFVLKRRWNWSLLLQTGGMPSSHSALVASVAHGIGLFHGYDKPEFALAIALAMVVIYDATGIRRQAGKHAEVINTMIQDLVEGHPLKESQLKEVLGHTPFEALGGTILGILVAQIVWWLW